MGLQHSEPHIDSVLIVYDSALVIQSIVQVLALRQSGDAPGNIYQNFVHTGLNKRIATHLFAKCAEHRPDVQKMLHIVHEALQLQGLGEV